MTENLIMCQPDTIKISLHGCKEETLNTRQPAALKILPHEAEEKRVERVRETLNMSQPETLKIFLWRCGR